MRFALVLGVAACGTTSGQPTWMTQLADDTRLASLSIPGTHDSAARFEPYPGIAMTQTLTFAEQLDAGVRYLDLRLRDVDDELDLYHGGIDQNQTLTEALAAITGFLDAHPGEVVLASVKEEAPASMATTTFEAAVRGYLDDHWFTGAQLPALGDARGKLVLVRRFAATAPLGIDATAWADNATFAIPQLAIEDEYQVTSNDLKWAAITAHLAAVGSTDDLFLTYTSGYQTVMGLPDITVVSDDVDARLDDFLAGEHGTTGVVVMDFATPERVAAVIAP